mmetsp:Transcript_118667/g.369706  ORF Transcript_118667/g.369706 Transcript_118667/m.369706 type:complete len:436 (+) Transcript_118667:158-1465(+)
MSSRGVASRLAAHLVLLLSWGFAEAKVKIRYLRLGPTPGPSRYRGNPWLFVGKFGFDRGQGTYSIRAQLAQGGAPPLENITIETYLDEDWPAVEAMEDPCNRTQLARRWRGFKVGPKGEWGPRMNGSVKQIIRPHVWYFTVSVCNTTQDFDRSYKIKFEFTAQQEDTSHFSYEQKWFPTGNMLVLVVLTAFMFVYAQRSYAFFLSAGSVHPVIWTLSAVLILQYIAQTLHTGHLFLYSSNGSGCQALEVLSEIAFVISQIVQTCLFILIALGYTLVQNNLGDLDMVVPLYLAVGIIHVVLVLVTKVQDEASHRFHDNEGPTGWMLLVFRLALYFWFLWGVRSTGAEAGVRLRSFLRLFTFAGSLYFLSYPAIFLIVDIFAPYLRAPILASGQTIMQLASNFWLSYLFLYRGEYFKVSTLGSSVLPGGSPRNFKGE